jgi:eukaryotic-like serine/threonine-protein kinase
MPQVAPLRPDDPKRVGRYRLTGRVPGILAGSRAYLGRATDGDRVTLAMLATDRTPDGAARDRFTAEARAARRVAPFCVARILDAGLEGDHAYLVSEFVAGPLLSETVAAAGPRTGAELEALAIGMATGLAAVHQAGLVHGEFGPAHVVLGTEGPRVIGFAITPPYGNATPAADMLAWAQTVLFAGSGGNPSAAALGSLPESLRGIVASCIAPEPAARPAARQVVIRLIGHESPQAGVLAEGSRRAAKAAMRAPAEPAAGVARPPAAGRRRRSRVVGTAAAATVCVLAIAVAVHVLQDASSNRGHAVNPDSANQPAASHTGSPPAPPSPTASSSPSVTLPAAVAGTWSGSVQQGSGNINTQVKLNGSSPAGTISYSGTSFTCSGKLTLETSASRVLRMNQEIVAGVCLDGVVTLTQEPDGSLKFNFKGASSLAATGVLTRQ